jgi:hypothetical protein
MLSAALDLARHRARHEHARLALERVLDGCRQWGIEVLPVKGILTARLFYPDPGLRPIQDIDLRVRPRDLGYVWREGARAGWRQLHRSRAYGTVAFDVLGFLVEFESHVGPPGLCDLSVEDMLRRAQKCVEPLMLPHLQPEIHDHALVLCVNAFKDKLVDTLPGAVRDLEIVPGYAGFSPEKLAALAKESGSATILWTVATWLSSRRGASAWARVRSALGRSAPRHAYAAAFERAIRASPPRRAWLRILARAGADRPAQRLRALGTLVFRAAEDALASRPVANRGSRRGAGFERRASSSIEASG